MNNTSTCRICMETDDAGNMIYPCKCAGTSKYVHKNCLNQWRTLSDNREAFYKCFECHYIYTIENNIEYTKTTFDKCIEHLSNYIITFILFNLGVIFCIFYFIINIDYNHHFLKFFFKNYNPKHISDYYLVLSSFLYLGVFLAIIMIKFSMYKNKLLYFKFYCRSWATLFIVLFFMFSLVCSVYLNSFYTLSMLTICIQLLFNQHINVQEKIKKENQMSILNYTEYIINNYGTNESTNESTNLFTE